MQACVTVARKELQDHLRDIRSLVPLLLNRASWRDILTGKWIAVSVFAVGSLMVSLAGFAVVLAKEAPESFAAAAPQLFAWICLGLIPLALMGAALQLLASTRCRSIKEAQSWLMMRCSCRWWWAWGLCSSRDGQTAGG
jgi:ABC-type Na+ efflux pump permease subunit